jgi:hypothetical protein
VRTRICLACRTLLGDGEACGAHGHQAISLGERVERGRLWQEVWGPDSRARQVRRAMKAGAGGGITGGISDCSGGCNGLDACNVLDAGEGLPAVLAGIVLAVVAAVLFFAVAWLIGKLVAYIRERMDKPKPHGALLAPPKVRGPVWARGRVRATTSVPLPWKVGNAVAYAFELHHKNVLGGGAMLRDAATAGFDVELDDGRIVRVPRGRVQLRGKLQKESVEREVLDAFLRPLDPGDEVGEPASDKAEYTRSLFPYAYARALVVSPGDQVDVLGVVETAADPSAPHAYRASAGLLVPVGVPMLRVRARARVDEGAPDVRVGTDGSAAVVDEELESEAASESEEPGRMTR